MFLKQEGQSTCTARNALNAAVADFVRFPLLPAAAARRRRLWRRLFGNVCCVFLFLPLMSTKKEQERQMIMMMTQIPVKHFLLASS